MKICRACCDTCVEPSVSITGYSLTSTTGPGDLAPCDSCCWYKGFVLDAPDDVRTNDCFMVCNNGSNSRYLVHRRITPGAFIDVWLSKSTCECSGYPSGTKWILSSRVRDGVDYFIWWNYGGLFGPVPTCFYSCPPIASTTPANCQWFHSGQCSSHLVYWFRQKVFTTYPTGAITFTNSDIVSCLLNTSPNIYNLPCTGATHAAITSNQTVTRDLVACVNTLHSGACTGTNNQSVTFSAPSWTINIA